MLPCFLNPFHPSIPGPLLSCPPCKAPYAPALSGVTCRVSLSIHALSQLFCFRSHPRPAPKMTEGGSTRGLQGGTRNAPGKKGGSSKDDALLAAWRSNFSDEGLRSKGPRLIIVRMEGCKILIGQPELERNSGFIDGVLDIYPKRCPAPATLYQPLLQLDLDLNVSGVITTNEREVWAMREAHLLRLCVIRVRTAACGVHGLSDN